MSWLAVTGGAATGRAAATAKAMAVENDANAILNSPITIAEILSEKPPADTRPTAAAHFRYQVEIDYIIDNPSLVKRFYIATHGNADVKPQIGTSVTSSFFCPANTLIINTGAGELCHVDIYTLPETIYLQDKTLRSTLYEMLGLCKTPSNPFLKTLYFTTPGQQVPTKKIHLKDEDDPETFGVFYVTSRGVYRVSDAIIDKKLKGVTTTQEFVSFMNELFPGSINLYYFSSCGGLPSAVSHLGPAQLWKNETHWSYEKEKYGKLECVPLEKTIAQILTTLNTYNFEPFEKGHKGIARILEEKAGIGPLHVVAAPTPPALVGKSPFAYSGPPATPRKPNDDNIEMMFARRGGYRRKRTHRHRNRRNRTRRHRRR